MNVILQWCVCSLTGRGLTFMTIDDVVTMPGYPVERSTWHSQALLMFYYNPNCELCRAVRTFTSDTDRRKRQAESDDNKLVVTSDIVHDMLNEQS